MSLAAPVAPRAANPGVQDLAPVEVDVIAQAVDEIGKLRDVFLDPNLMRDLVGDRNHRARVVRKWRRRHQNEVVAVFQPTDDFLSGLPALILAEELFDVFDLERALLERILRNPMLQRALSSLPSALCPYCVSSIRSSAPKTIVRSLSRAAHFNIVATLGSTIPSKSGSAVGSHCNRLAEIEYRG